MQTSAKYLRMRTIRRRLFLINHKFIEKLSWAFQTNTLLLAAERPKSALEKRGSPGQRHGVLKRKSELAYVLPSELSYA